ncbi:polysaccharide pyruvyl transferase family protein [Vibrio breoganii]
MINNEQKIWHDSIVELKKEHEKIANIIGGRRVAFLDIPAYFNVGDFLIYKGTEQFFNNHNIDVCYRCDCHNYSIKKIAKADVIVFQGGGNFGDLYSDHQRFREKVIGLFPNKVIIILPQTVHFSNKDNLNNCIARIGNHSSLYFFARDNKSYDIAKNITDRVMLCPDMAYSLEFLVDASEVGPSNVKPRRIMNMCRVDIENNGQTSSVKKQGFDWEDMITKTDRLYLKIYRLARRFPWLRERAQKIWINIMEDIIFRGVKHFYIHDIIHTDRLHGMILGTLLGKPIVMRDNSYGKNSGFSECWLKKYPYFEGKNTNNSAD